MNTILNNLTGNRKWLVRDFTVWGDSDIFDAAVLATENDDGSNVVFLRELVGGQAQIIEYIDLVDHRGNVPPDTISNPEIIIVPKNHSRAFVVGTPGNSSFRIAKSPGEALDPVVDLLIMEMK